MNKHCKVFGFSLLAFLYALLPARSATLSTNTFISWDNTNFDGLDLEVTNCIVTLDGLHTLSSLHVENGGTITHSASSNAVLQNVVHVTNELQTISAFNPPSLNFSNVFNNTIVITDTNSTLTYTQDVDYAVASLPNGFTQILLLTNSAIADGSIVSINYDALSLVPVGVNLVVSNNVQIEVGGSIAADGIGYGPAMGAGAGQTTLTNVPFSFAAGSGAGYGGFGGSNSLGGAGGICYGDALQPADAGSGGGRGNGPGGAGGGAIKIVAGGILRLDGQITANGGAGTNSHSGGGSGGGIWLSAQSFSGNGSLRANGGAGEPPDGGGGGGGRIALNCASNYFTGTIAAQGGAGAVRGGAGTIFTTTNGLAKTGQLLIDNGGSKGANTLITISGFYDLVLSGGSVAQGSNAWTFASLLVRSNSFITHPQGQSLSLSVLGNATIESGGGLVANSRGYLGGVGPGAGGSVVTPFGFAGGGAGYGGYGGANFTNFGGGTYYGSGNAPTDFGSGGGQGAGSSPNNRGGSGGGNIHLIVNGTLRLDGSLTVDGGNGLAQGSGGGSGGSLWLQAGQLSGAGLISANGGGGEMPLGGGGAGGRIAIFDGTNHFTGLISAHGGPGAMAGGAGTVYLGITGAQYYQLIVDNGGIRGTNTPLQFPGSSLDLTIGNGASVDASLQYPPGTFPAIHDLVIQSNGWVTTTATSRQIALSISGSFTVLNSAGFLLDGLVPAGTQSSGPGQSGTSPFPSGGGGGHGGNGGSSAFGAAGGAAYDSITAPVLPGSFGGNGNGSTSNNLGGSGGGALQLTVGGSINFSGIISANGTPGIGQWSGGGSGGSVFITTTGNFGGSGSISANGGSGDPVNGGGGGGGRISINYGSRNFIGAVNARGGSGTNYGGAGTTYWKAANSLFGQVIFDNGGFAGTNSPFNFSTPSDLSISGGAVIAASTLPTSMGTLFIGSNSFLSFTSSITARTITVVSNVIVQSGGGITLDGQGNNQQGAGSFGTGSGGGYGGFGGNGSTNRGGGIAYGSISSPIDLGSPGAGAILSSGGAGGGALHLIIGGNLTLDGAISARGNPGLTNASGGGSGGSLWIASSRMSGAGLFSADGGAGNLPNGGGGAGGRIAVFFATNQFTGVLSAHGGSGANYGGAGTIYLQASNTFSPLIVVDNGNAPGTNTPLSFTTEQCNLMITGGAHASAVSLPFMGNLLIGSNSFLIYSNFSGARSLTITTNATIQAGGVFFLDGMGSPYLSGSGPGQTLGSSGGGGGHGGTGGNSANNASGGIVYDSISSPTGVGSGGGGTVLSGVSAPGTGGGALHLTVNGTLALEGIVTANGTPGTSSASGGGSGGSIFLTLGKFTGSGVVSANGGSGNLPAGGGGGGGRIAILYNTNQFTGTLFARGGAGANYGGAGTIYLASNKGIQGTNTLIVDNGGNRGATTPISTSGLASVNLSLAPGSIVPVSNSLSFVSLSISSNSFLASQHAVITVTGNATVQSGGGIVMDGLGYPASQSPGAGGTLNAFPNGITGGGGGYAGYGGNSQFGAAGGNSYGVFDAPIDFGSGGGNGNGLSTNFLGGAGGGALQLTVNGTLACDGKISADGLTGPGQWSGGGSGGSVWLTVGKLSGAGLISANGASGDLPNGGGGGGGRIAIVFTTNNFNGTLLAHGGAGAIAGGAGTIYLRTNSVIGSTTSVLLDNGSLRGTNTPLPLANAYYLTVGGGAIGNPALNANFSNLVINSNGWLSQLRNDSNLAFTVLGNATIHAGGGILANGPLGIPGAGAGGSLNSFSDAWTGGGGGYGGLGAASSDGAIGGNSYGSLTQPVSVGSAGGGFQAFSLGAPGGGAVNVTVLGNLALDGQISANGHDAIVEGAGGGSGGSVLLTVGSLSGTGAISANGGHGDFFQGGGGGGGRLAIYYGTNTFLGHASAYGGGGAFFGGAGTIYSKANSNAISQILVDNGGNVGANTPLPSVPTADLSITGGAVANPAAQLLLNSLIVDSQASLTHSPLSNLDLIIFGDALIGTNGSIVANGKGYTLFNGGPGAGQMPANNAGSGGGYGGAGGASATGVLGGSTYGSAQQPTDLGSSGGYDLAATGFVSLSQGGGAVRLRVAGRLTVNGKITANGNDAIYDRSGGGAGGSVWLTASNFDGHGFITANGGAGEPFDGGGGGGGRIAINSRGNTFSGPVVAFGGFGASFGNNGTVIITNIPAPQVISQVPFTVVSYSVSNVDLTFDSPINPASVSPSDLILYTPDGSLPSSSVTVTTLGLSSFRFSFPPQNTVGYYEIDAGPDIQDFYGLSMADTYIGSFVISARTISGRVATTNGSPVAFVTLNAGTDVLPVVTDSSGQYSLEVPPGWTGVVTPSKGSTHFIPAARTYTAVSADFTNQNFITVTPALLTMHSQVQGGNVNLNWFGIDGVAYQTLYSTNLINWLPYGSPFVGTNGPVSLVAPIGSVPNAFFRFTTSY